MSPYSAFPGADAITVALSVIAAVPKEIPALS